MEASSSSTPGLSENIEDSHVDLDYGLLPAFSTSPLRSEIPERLLQDDASTLRPSHSEQNLTMQNFLQENAYSPQGLPLPQNDPTQQEEVAFPGHENTQDQPEDVSESSSALFREQNHAEAGQDLQKPSRKPHSWKEKLGIFAIVGLIAGPILLCAAVGALAFIWFGSPAIPAWREITARNWLSKAISICIGVIQQVMMLQLGIVTAALASLALESRDVVIGDVASVSAMRAAATSTGTFVMAWQYLSGGSHRSAQHSSNILLILSAALLWCLSQFLLLIILTDVSLRSTAGLASLASLPYSLHYNVSYYGNASISYTRFQLPSVGAWNRKLSKYASFAEYSEPPYEADGVSDTGVTLRAFLPFRTAQDRENLKSYKGNLTLLDARVTCQVPQIKNATVESDHRFRGSLAETRNTPRLANVTTWNDGEDHEGGVHFDCLIDWQTIENKQIRDSKWSLTLCQLWKSWSSNSGMPESLISGGLYSEFQNPSIMDKTWPDYAGSAYLFLNTTIVTFQDNSSLPGLSIAEASQERGEWLDMIYSNGSAIISASICHAAFDFADVDVTISSRSNRTESRLEPAFDPTTATYSFQQLRDAMGQGRSLPVEQRGILELAKGIWQVAPDRNTSDSRTFSSFDLRKTADLGFTYSLYPRKPTTPYMTGDLSELGSLNISQYDACVYPEQMHRLLINDILKKNGSIAFALQTMITLLSSMAYYDQMDYFDKWTQAEVTFFQTAQVPVRNFGFAVVTIAVVAHCGLVAYCISLFLRKTTLSRLGASWSAVAQVATGDVMQYLEHATQASDNDLQARLKADGKKSSKVCLEEVDGQVSISIIGKDEEKYQGSRR